MTNKIRRVAEELLPRAADLLADWLPGGRLRGAEFVCGSLRGEPGDSLSVNVHTGRWADFATGDRGGDLVSLYAAIHGLSQSDAAQRLSPDAAFVPKPRAIRSSAPRRTIDAPLQRPPADAPPPPPHPKWGNPVALYPYHDAVGLVGYVARYEPSGQRKTFAPYRWIDGRWVAKALPRPRPLYRTERLLERPDAAVVVCEGEKAAEAAARLLPRYVACSWAGGAQSVESADWATLARRRVVLWPDADEPGRQAMARVAPILAALGCDVYTINPDGQPDGWDAADALQDGWTTAQTRDWAKPRLVHYEPPAPQQDRHGHPAAVDSSLPRPVTTATAGARNLDPPDDLHPRQLWDWYGLDTTIGNGTPPANEDTVVRVLGHKSGAFWYDEFLQRPITTWGGTAPRPLEDADVADLLVWMQRVVRLHRLSASTVERGLQVVLYRNRRNVAQEWLRSLVWDGVERVHLLFTHGFGTDDHEYYRAVAKNFMIGMVHRVLEPGCQFDYVPILEGRQGARKSTALRTLGGEWFAECHEPLTSKDFLQLLPGKMLIEFSELHAMSRAEAEKVKGILSNRVDRYRASYGRRAGDYPRSCVFAGTTNRDDWNRDDTGARRFWRIIVGEIDVDWIARHREQLFAESVVRLQRGESHHEVPQQVARWLQQDAMARDAWHDVVIGYASRFEEVRPEQILREALDVPIDRTDNAAIQRVRSILRSEGWVRKTARLHGSYVKVWRRPSVADDSDDWTPSGLPPLSNV